MAESFLPLTGLRVLELSQHVAGGYCGHVLTSFGADVTRVDLPWSAYVHPDLSVPFREVLDRGKTLVAAARDELYPLARNADLIISDCRGWHDDHGNAEFADDVMRQASTSAAVTRIAAFQRAGQTADWVGDSLVASAWTSASWSIDSRSRSPLTLPSDLPEYLVGTHAAAVSVVSLIGGTPGGVNEVAMTDTLGYIVSMIVTNFIPYGREWHRDGPRATQSGGCYPGAIFECKDGPITVMCRQQREWDGLRLAMRSPAWAADERFSDPRIVARLYADEADEHLKPWIAAHTRAEIRALGAEFNFPVAPIRDVSDNLDDPQFAHRQFFESVVLPGGDAVRIPGVPHQVTNGTAKPSPRSSRSPLPTSAPTATAGPLAGVRVLDLSWVWSGPMVTSVLSDLGAEVIKVEHGSHPDAARARGRGLVNGVERGGPALELSPYFNQLGHDKLSIAVDLSAPEGQQLLLDLAASCDIVVENMRPGVLARQGLGYPALQAVNENIILLSMSVMGQTGPASGMMGYGVVMSGFAGLEGLVGYPDEVSGLFNLALSDPNAGGHALVALFAALYRQRRTGQGAWIDLSQTECTLAVLIEPLLEAQLKGGVTRPAMSHPSAAPYGHYRAAGHDNWLAVAVHSDEQRTALAALLSLDAEAQSSLEDLLTARSEVSDATSFATELQAVGVPAAPVNSFEQLEKTGWYDAIGFTADLDHPYLERQELMAVPWRLGEFQPRPTRSAPLLGQDTTMVLHELLGMTDEEIHAARDRGVLGPEPPLSR